MAGFTIKREDITSLLWEYSEKLNNVMAQLDKLSKSVELLIQNTGFTGETAVSVKNYLSDVHMVLITSLQMTAQALLDQIGLYIGGYEDIDSSEAFILNEEVMEACRTHIRECYKECYGLGDELEEVLNGISDIHEASRPSREGFVEANESVNAEITNLTDDINAYEENTVAGLEELSGTLMSPLRESIRQAGTEIYDVTEYQQYSFFRNINTSELLGGLQAYEQYHESNEERLNEIWNREWERKEAREREEEGWWEVITAATVVVVGAACIIASAGAATPVVVAAWTAGGAAAAFGLAI